MPPRDREITAAAELCDARGRLDPRAIGWARRPIVSAALPSGWPRRKRWHHWCVTSTAEVVALTVADLDYLGVASLVVIDRAGGRTLRRGAARPLGWRMDLPRDAVGGEVALGSMGLALSFRGAAGGVRLKARARGVEVDVEVERPPGHESLTVVVPWSDRRFQLTTKETALPATGTLRLDGRSRALAAGAFATQDFGRGIWPYRTSWNWAGGAGTAGGRTIGLNLGARWTDGTGLDENALTIDGVLHPLEGGVAFDWDRARPLAPWRLHGPEVELRFTPEVRERALLPLGVVAADLTLCFGRFAGRVLSHAVEDLFGWAEELHARW